MKLNQAIERAQAALISAQKELAIAKIQQAENEGRITPEQGAEMRAAIDRKAIEDQQRAHEEAQNKEVNDKRAAFAKMQDQQPALERDAAAKRATATAEEDHKAGAIAAAPKPSEMKKAMDELGEKEEAWANFVYWNKGRTESEADLVARMKTDPDLAMGQSKYDEYQSALARQKTLSHLAEQGRQAENTGAAIEADKDAAKKAEEKAKANSDDMPKLGGEIQQFNNTIAATRPIERQTAGARESAIDVQQAGESVKRAGADARAIDEFERSKNPTSQQLDRAVAAIKDWNSIGPALAVFLNSIPNANALLDEIEAAKRRITSIEQTTGLPH